MRPNCPHLATHLGVRPGHALYTTHASEYTVPPSSTIPRKQYIFTDGDQSPVSNGFPSRETIDGKTGARGVSAGPFLADRGDRFNNGQATDKRLEC